MARPRAVRPAAPSPSSAGSLAEAELHSVRAPANSAALAKRSAGSRASARRQSALSAGSTSGRKVRGASGVEVRTLSRVARMVASSKGGDPVRAA